MEQFCPPREKWSKKGVPKMAKTRFLAFFRFCKNDRFLDPLFSEVSKTLYANGGVVPKTVKKGSKKGHFRVLDPFFGTPCSGLPKWKSQRANHPEMAISPKITGPKKVKKGLKKGQKSTFWPFFRLFREFQICPL